MSDLPRELRSQVYDRIGLSHVRRLRELARVDPAAISRAREAEARYLRLRSNLRDMRGLAYDPPGDRSDAEEWPPMPANVDRRALAALWAARLLPSIVAAYKIVRNMPMAHVRRGRPAVIHGHTTIHGTIASGRRRVATLEFTETWQGNHIQEIVVSDDVRRAVAQVFRHDDGTYTLFAVTLGLRAQPPAQAWINFGWMPSADILIGGVGEFGADDYRNVIDDAVRRAIRAARVHYGIDGITID